MGAAFCAICAGIGTDSAMFVLIRVAAAFAGAGAAKRDARRQLGLQGLAVPRLICPRHDAAGSSAHGCAIQVQSDAGDQGFDVFFREAGIRAGRAGLNAERARVDASRDRVGVSRLFGVGAKHSAHD